MPQRVYRRAAKRCRVLYGDDRRGVAPGWATIDWAVRDAAAPCSTMLGGGLGMGVCVGLGTQAPDVLTRGPSASRGRRISITPQRDQYAVAGTSPSASFPLKILPRSGEGQQQRFFAIIKYIGGGPR